MATIAENLKSIADSKAAIKTAIIAKGVAVADSDALSTYAGKINDISSGGGTDDLPNFIARTATDITDSNVTAVGDYACNAYTNLASANFPNCTVVGAKSFSGCSGLKSISMSSLQTVNNNAFQGCTALDNVKLPSVTIFNYGSFYGCTSLTNLEIGKYITKITSPSFDNCPALSTITINRKQNAVGGSPWGAPSTCTVNWTGTA